MMEIYHNALVALLCEHPQLMERPIVVFGGRAVVARPSELIYTLR
ncbi:MAG: ArsC/Spx/MgsR family protein [Flavobacteriaceae bacterium]